MSHKDVPSIRRWLSFAILVATLFVYSLLAPFGYALLAVVSLFPTRDFKRRALFLQAIVRGAFRVCHAYLRRVGILDYRPTDVVPPDVDGCVVIANHPTLTDAMALLASVPGACTAVRADLYEKFFLRPLLRGSGHFSAGFGHPLSGKSVVESSVERLAQGFRVLLFPEGTRSPVGGGLRRFGRSAFEVACRADVPVVALVIHESPPWLAKGSRIAAPKEVMSVKSVQLVKVVHPRDFFGDSRLMRDYVESAYRQALALPEESGRDSKTSEGAPAPMMKAIGE
jgi:1-acyl-sn-glycerol-3-phosphate acyltransferase